MKRDAQTTILQACARFVRRQLEPVLARLGGIEQRALTVEKLMDSVQVRDAIAGLATAAVKAQPTVQPQPGKDGTSVTVADVAPLIAEQVRSAVAAIPLPPPGDKGDPGKDGEDGKSLKPSDVEPMLKEMVRFAVEAIPAPKPGEPGKPGRDAEPVLVADVVKELIACAELRPILDLMVSEALAKHLEAHPIRPGKDGKDGDDGKSVTEDQVRAAVAEHLRANPPAKGEPGRDGLDVKDFFRADGGRLMAVLSDGTTRDLGVFVGKDGDPGKHGRDGVAPFVHEYDGHRTLTVKTLAGEVVQVIKLSVPMDAGFWRAGMKCEKGDIVTEEGSAWIALQDTTERPGYAAKEHWRLFARKGRDGSDAGTGSAPPAPIKLDTL